MRSRERIDRWITASVLAFAGFVPLSIVGEQVSLGFLILGLVLRAWFFRDPPTKGRSIFAGPLLLHAATLALSVALTAIPEVTGGERYNLWRLLALLALASALDRDRELTDWAVKVFLGVLFFVSLYAIVQHYTGIDLTRGAGREVAVPADFLPGRFRPTGTFNWYSTLAFVLATGLAFAFALILESRRSLRYRALLLLASLPSVLALAFTQVRATWIGLGAGFLLGAILRGRRTLMWVTLVGVLVVSGVLGLSPAVRAKAGTTFDLAYRNNAERVFMWVRALEMVADRPGTGIGHGSYTPATAWYYDRWDAEFPVRCHAHNNYLHFWATAGPLALLCYLWIFAAFFRHLIPAYREARRSRDELAAGLSLGALVAVVGFLLGSFFQDPYFDGEVFYGLIFALAVGGAVVRWTAPAREGLRPMVVALFAVLAGTGVGLAQGPVGLGLDPLSPGHGVAGSVLVGAAIFFLGALALLWREGARDEVSDTFLWSAGITAVLTMAGPFLVLEGMAAPLKLEGNVSPWLGLTALPPLLVAVGVYLLARRPGAHRGAGSIFGLLALGALGATAWHGLGSASPPASAAVAGARESAPFAGEVTWAGHSCRGAIVSPIGLLTTGACAARLSDEVSWNDRAFACDRATGALPQDLALVRCRSVEAGTDLRDLVVPLRSFPRDFFPGVSSRDWARMVAQIDHDRDGTPDPVDGCARFDPTQTDTDRDGVTDACEPLRLVAPLGDGRYFAAGSKGEVFTLRLEAGEAAPVLRLATPIGFQVGSQPLSGIAGVAFGSKQAEPLLMAVAELPGSLYRMVPGEAPRIAGPFRPRSGWVGLAAARLPPWASGSEGGELLVGARQQEPALVVYSLGAEGRLETLAASPMREEAAEVLAMAVGDLGGDGFDELLLLRGGELPRLEVFRPEPGHRILREVGSVTLPALGNGGPAEARVTLLAERRRIRLYDREGALHELAVRPDRSALHLDYLGQKAQGPPAHWIVSTKDGLFAYRVRDPALELVTP